MKAKSKEWIFPHLEEKLWEAHISISEIAKLLGITRQAIYPKMRGEIGWNRLQMEIIKQELEKRLRRNFTIDYLFKEDSPNGNK